MSALLGGHFWNGARQPAQGPVFAAIEAATGRELAPSYADATPAEIEVAMAFAAAAAGPFAALPAARRAQFLNAIADRIVELGDALLARAHAETALPMARLVAERGRTVGQLRLFAGVVTEGSWIDARIDRADAARTPMPKPDLRAMYVPLGPVAVFGASNFPFAYSVAGGDTASALAVGCPVVVKAHPAHPGTSELVATAIVAAQQACGVPAGAFAMLQGRSHEVGRRLVEDRRLAAVGFTGSKPGGTALTALAAARKTPIPVFAEMGSVNPVFVLSAAQRERGADIAQRVAASAMQAVGQFCTSPGMVVFVDDGDAAFAAAVQEQFARAEAGTLVHPSIRANFDRARAEVASLPGVRTAAVAPQQPACAATGAQPVLLATTAETVLLHDRLREEIYGPAMLLVACRSNADMLAIAQRLDGHLTATVHGTAADLQANGELLTVLRQKVGRLIHGGVPTGVEVVAAMQHGGPWPASSDSRFTAVGPRALLRWVRPLSFQDAPSEVLPLELRDGNPCGIWRTVDGVLGRH